MSAGAVLAIVGSRPNASAFMPSPVGSSQSRCRCGRGWARSRCRCGRGEPHSRRQAHEAHVDTRALSPAPDRPHARIPGIADGVFRRPLRRTVRSDAVRLVMSLRQVVFACVEAREIAKWAGVCREWRTAGSPPNPTVPHLPRDSAPRCHIHTGTVMDGPRPSARGLDSPHATHACPPAASVRCVAR
jgi:hypothetical protein